MEKQFKHIFFKYINNRMTDIIKFIKQMTSNTSNSNVMEGKRQVVTRLKFIASIAPNEKIDSRNLTIESTSIWTPFKRFFYGDSRSATMSFFSSTIDRTFEVINAHIHSKNMEDRLFCANMINDLMSAVKGLKAFQQTYEDDKLISCEISVIIESIEAKVYSIRSNHPDMFTIKKEFVTQMERQELVQDSINKGMFNPIERVDGRQSYKISSTAVDDEKKEGSSGLDNFPTIKNAWNGKKTVFDPSLEDTDDCEDEPLENKRS